MDDQFKMLPSMFGTRLRLANLAALAGIHLVAREPKPKRHRKDRYRNQMQKASRKKNRNK